MQKKFIATLLMSVLAVVCFASLCACGTNVPKGDAVTAEEWQSAFSNSRCLENYTLNVKMTTKANVNGTVTVDKTSNLIAKSEVSVSVIELMDIPSNGAYQEESSQTVASGEADGELYDTSDESVSKAYWEFKEDNFLYNAYWKAAYSKKNSKTSKEINSSEKFWDASTSAYFAEDNLDYLYYMGIFYESDEEGTLSKNLEELYDKFTYNSGTYTATLYQKVWLANEVQKSLKCIVTVSIDKKSNCVACLSTVTEGAGNVNESIKYYNLSYSYDFNYTYREESVFILSDVGKTNPASKATGDIAKVIEKAKKDAETK